MISRPGQETARRPLAFELLEPRYVLAGFDPTAVFLGGSDQDILAQGLLFTPQVAPSTSVESLGLVQDGPEPLASIASESDQPEPSVAPRRDFYDAPGLGTPTTNTEVSISKTEATVVGGELDGTPLPNQRDWSDHFANGVVDLTGVGDFTLYFMDSHGSKVGYDLGDGFVVREGVQQIWFNRRSILAAITPVANSSSGTLTIVGTDATDQLRLGNNWKAQGPTQIDSNGNLGFGNVSIYHGFHKIIASLGAGDDDIQMAARWDIFFGTERSVVIHGGMGDDSIVISDPQSDTPWFDGFRVKIAIDGGGGHDHVFLSGLLGNVESFSSDVPVTLGDTAILDAGTLSFDGGVEFLSNGDFRFANAFMPKRSAHEVSVGGQVVSLPRDGHTGLKELLASANENSRLSDVVVDAALSIPDSQAVFFLSAFERKEPSTASLFQESNSSGVGSAQWATQNTPKSS